MKPFPITWLYLLLSWIVLVACNKDGNCSLESAILEEENRTDISDLSRRKRYLSFPDGSSLQLVFCLQTSAIIPIGDIFLFGNTAALAWELPKDPIMLFKDQKGPLRRKDDAKNTYYSDDTGEVLYKVPHRSRPFVPVFAKRSVNPPVQISTPQESPKTHRPPGPEAQPIDRKRLHAQWRREFLKTEHMSKMSVEFHRLSRRGLYEKLELLLKALGMNGRQCLLRMLCETGAREREDEQGTIMEEMMRAVFTLHRDIEFEADQQEYDNAHQTGENCELIYPDCHPFVDTFPTPFY